VTHQTLLPYSPERLAEAIPPAMKNRITTPSNIPVNTLMNKVNPKVNQKVIQMMMMFLSEEVGSNFSPIFLKEIMTVTKNQPNSSSMPNLLIKKRLELSKKVPVMKLTLMKFKTLMISPMILISFSS